MDSNKALNIIDTWFGTYNSLQNPNLKAQAKSKILRLCHQYKVPVGIYFGTDTAPQPEQPLPICKNPNCQKHFVPVNKYQLYCSKTCKNDFHNNKHK